MRHIFGPAAWISHVDELARLLPHTASDASRNIRSGSLDVAVYRGVGDEIDIEANTVEVNSRQNRGRSREA